MGKSSEHFINIGSEMNSQSRFNKNEYYDYASETKL